MKYQKRTHWDQHRPEFLKVGFIFALAISLMAFNYTSSPPTIEPFDDLLIIEEDILITPPPTVQKKKVLSPPPPAKVTAVVDFEPTSKPILIFEEKVETKREWNADVAEFANDPIAETSPIVMPVVDKEPKNSAPVVFAERMPIYGNCDIDLEESERRDCTNQNLIKHIYAYVKYPPQARKYKVEGTVVVSFVVNKSGNVENIEIVKDIGMGCGDEVKRVIKKLYQFSPGKQNGRPVSVIYKLPVKFSLL